ncbi:DUF7691 family protein [Bergeriella denitrificans]|uniref:DUF7691 domain-containing protein n=1 Tax=Bergeriella denitrificans TaxID=494 RepID=A0A378UG67_BERDE|nr:hypothetical protein [Bergeriella denitrificans]STZ76388.1 Uncharacterised protein [Bergeriella denitrificans]
MGLYLTAYAAIRPDAIKQVFGSKDDALFTRLADGLDLRDVETDTLSAENALRHIIYGEAMDTQPENAHLYGYALLEICQALGETLPCSFSVKLGEEADAAGRILDGSLPQPAGWMAKLKSLFSPAPRADIVAMLMGGKQHGFDIPAIDDFPEINILHPADLQTLYDTLNAINIDEAQVHKLQNSDNEHDEISGSAYEHLAALRRNVHFCLARGLSLVLACH